MNKQRHGLTVMAAAVAVLICGIVASADPIRFDNAPVGDPDHFVWYGGTGTDPIGLNVMTDLAGQDGSYGGVGDFHQGTQLPDNDFVAAGAAGGQLQVGGDGNYFLVGVDYLTEIPSGTPWRDNGLIYHPQAPAPHTWLPLDTPTYLGVQFPDTDGTHYGWIGVEMFIDGTSGAYCLDTFAWGYETTPDTPIAAGVPEPATLALLAIGAVGVLRRRRA